jgi:hypothetical protein
MEVPSFFPAVRVSVMEPLSRDQVVDHLRALATIIEMQGDLFYPDLVPETVEPNQYEEEVNH